MASGLHFIQSNLPRNLSQCIKHSTCSFNPCKSRWRSITSLSIFNPGLVEEDTYPDLKKCDTTTKTLDLCELKKKEKGDWRNLSLQEKQALYHMSFNQPFCYVDQPTDEWKFILGGTFTAMGLMTLGLYIWLAQSERTETVVGPLSLQIDPKNKEDMSLSFNKELSRTE